MRLVYKITLTFIAPLVITLGLWGWLSYRTLFDQLSKFMVVNLLPWQEGVSVIKGFVQFYYDTNDGMAFGALDNHRWVFMILSPVALVLFGWYLNKHRDAHKLFTVSLAFVIGGGVANMIDRVFIQQEIEHRKR